MYVYLTTAFNGGDLSYSLHTELHCRVKSFVSWTEFRCQLLRLETDRCSGNMRWLLVYSHSFIGESARKTYKHV